MLQGVSSLKVLQMPMTGPAVELVVRHALALDPAAVDEAVAVLPAEPLLAAKFFGFLAPFVVHCSLSRKAARHRPGHRNVLWYDYCAA